MSQTKILLDESEIPTHWYNVAAYDKYFAGQLEDYVYPEAAIAASMQKLPKVAAG